MHHLCTVHRRFMVINIRRYQSNNNFPISSVRPKHSDTRYGHIQQHFPTFTRKGKQPLLLNISILRKTRATPFQVQKLFSIYRNEVYHLSPPGEESRRNFFKSLILEECLRQPRKRQQRPKTPPPLPRAPTPPPTPLTEEQCRKLYETEEKTLRELRIFLRDMCKKLANNKL